MGVSVSSVSGVLVMIMWISVWCSVGCVLLCVVMCRCYGCIFSV